MKDITTGEIKNIVRDSYKKIVTNLYFLRIIVKGV